MSGNSWRMGERRGSKEQNNEDKSTVDIKSLEIYNLCVYAKDMEYKAW